MWTARAGIEQDLSEVERAFSAARDDGLANLENIADAHADDLGLSAEQCLTYLRDHLHFYLGDAERQSMDLFRDYVGELFPAARPIKSI
jgi:chorismate dehydratase